jgi:hypothetical protein
MADSVAQVIEHLPSKHEAKESGKYRGYVVNLKNKV